MTTEKQVTAEEALLWLAELEQPCVQCAGAGIFRASYTHAICPNCGGSGKVPVLDLRELCTNCQGKGAISDGHKRQLVCPRCLGRNWVPKQGEQALYQAVHDARWDMGSFWLADYPQPSIRFYRHRPVDGLAIGEGSDASAPVAAYKAMRAAGY